MPLLAASFSWQKASGVAALIGCVLVWSSWAIASRWGLIESALGPWELGLLRFTFAAAVLGPVLWRMGWGGVPVRTALILAATAGPGYVAFTYNGLQYAPAAHGAALTAGMLPLFTAALAWLLGADRLTRLKLIGLVLMVSAAGLFFLHGFGLPAQNVWLGDLLLLGGPAVWAIYAVTLRGQGLHPVRATAFVATLGFCMFVPMYLVMGEPARFLDTPLPAILLTGVFHGWVVVVLAMTLFTHAIRTLGPASTTLATAAAPGATAIGAWFVLGEALTPLIAAGIVLEAIGLLFVAASIARGVPAHVPMRPAAANST